MSRKAFTLIELLVVIAIIAILAAILFPVFAQAKAAAKATAALSNTKQTGTATLIYTNDADDIFPLAGVLRPAGGKLGMGLAYPYPYNDGEKVSNGANTVWQGAARQAMAQAWGLNALQPYMKSYPLAGYQGLSTWTDPARVFPGAPFAAPVGSALSMNGDLHKMSTTAVTSPSVCILFWDGNGDHNANGIAADNPSLNCGGTVDDCQFNNGAPPSATLNIASQPGDVMYLPLDGKAGYNIFGNLRGPMVRTDTSAKALPQGTVRSSTSYISLAGALTDPYANVVDGSGFGWWPCDNGSGTNTETLGTSSQYSCYFRPDRVK